MSRAEDESTPGSGTETGGAEDRSQHHQPDAPSIARAGGTGEPADLLPDVEAAVDFLESWRPGGPWVLTAIPVEGGPTRTVTLAEPGAVKAWVHDHSGGGWNLYFTVNETAGQVRKKPSKQDIVAASGLHVDMDPRPGEPLDRERERALRMLKGYSPAPTVITDSGGGFQGFWAVDCQ